MKRDVERSSLLEDLPFKEIKFKTEEERIKYQNECVVRLADAIDRGKKTVDEIFGKGKPLIRGEKEDK